ncbi:cation-binding protein [Microbacterium mangrovi]|uniref:Cation-binding protein n=1 Tax=Microbacterium mangrovi TaxID=1348253 RepID=A0A0B2A7P5_9MICO|nr:hemerythrin domain-containing protein [Microbacterium mangrovi]KHK99125.1 cation-binding protein [Microbacterium mangrovi]
MAEGEKARLIAWGNELQAVHRRLRQTLQAARSAIRAGSSNAPAEHDLLLFCHGFCAALTGHHEGERDELFPAIATQYPELRDALRTLEEDHSLIARLLDDLRAATDRADAPDRLERHLDGIAAIMESHFQYEERQLLSILETLQLDADPRHVFGRL